MRTDRILATLVVILIGAPVVFATYAVLARYVLHGPVDGESLGRSVARESHWATGTCRRTPAPGEWRCVMSDASTSRPYRVRVKEGSSCWEAPLLKAEGCVRRW